MVGMASTDATGSDARADRTTIRSVAVPTEHGGWGLTLEPVVLGLLVAPSVAGAVLGLAAFLTFLARTPLKLVLVDRHRARWLPRTRRAATVAAAELTVIAVLATIAGLLGGWRWLWVAAIALPLAGIELWYDARSRSRRLVPELLGTIGVAAAAPAIVVIDDSDDRLAIAVWLLLAARGLGSIPFVRAQIALARRGVTDTRTSDAFQLVSVAVAAAAVVVDDRALWGALAVAALAIAQIPWARRAPTSIKRLGITQMVIGFAIVGVTACGVRLV